MKFKNYYLSLSAKNKRELAVALKTSVPYLSHIAHGYRQAGAKFLLNIEKVTNGRVKPTGLRDS